MYIANMSKIFCSLCYIIFKCIFKLSKLTPVTNSVESYAGQVGLDYFLIILKILNISQKSQQPCIHHNYRLCGSAAIPLVCEKLDDLNTIKNWMILISVLLLHCCIVAHERFLSINFIDISEFYCLM